MEQLKTDIVVVGAGASGIGAALSAAPENNARVILLEKGNKFGGAGMFGAQGLFAAGSRLQKAVISNYSPKDAYVEMVNYTHIVLIHASQRPLLTNLQIPLTG
ncbi:Fumarate reductase (quinol) [Lactiplantibacillus plantarum subsp. plantarum]|uniref:Fumarate reductase (Quinol) n=1 Tax=Lactiplantibacillus plantarum subsp. plantarum TaxID=337330 RepID=A0A2S3U9Q2_LACPN|nr:Fumarate reductase (quinol) [Lactiplantibacillus plantarum subsp. plantarum]